MWSVYSDRGFLPKPDPIELLPIHDPPEHSLIEQMAADLPALVVSKKFRKLVCKMSIIDYSTAPDEHVERLMLIYSYFASAYVWGSEEDEEEKFIPKGIAIPLVYLARRVKRPPILSYASYCLHNWRRLPEYQTTVDTTQLLQNFVDCEDEDWFILIHVDIEAKGGLAVSAIQQSRHAVWRDDPTALEDGLKDLSSAIKAMSATLARMPERCSPDVYFHKVRPYIYGFNDVVYEGCFTGRPQSFRGETGAQSSLVPAIQSALGIRHKSSILTTHLDDMRRYMPLPHRSYLKELDASVPPYDCGDRGIHPERFDIRKMVIELKNESLKDDYNHCIEQLWKFRNLHFEYAVEYIHNKVTDPTGTGGTPFMKWLDQITQETEAHFL